MRVLETERLLLKPTEIEDLDYLLNLRWDKEVVNYLLHDPISIKKQHDWFNNLKTTDVPLSIFLKEKGELKIIGTIGLYEIDQRHQRAKWKLRIDPAYHGKGYARESGNLLLDYAFNTLNLNKITGDAFADNADAIRFNKSCGLKEEGTLVEQYFHNGKFRNAIQLGLLRKDFNSNKKTSAES